MKPKAPRELAALLSWLAWIKTPYVEPACGRDGIDTYIQDTWDKEEACGEALSFLDFWGFDVEELREELLTNQEEDPEKPGGYIKTIREIKA